MYRSSFQNASLCVASRLPPFGDNGPSMAKLRMRCRPRFTHLLSIFRRDISNLHCVLSDVIETVREPYTFRRGGTLCERKTGPPFFRWADRPRDKAAAAIRANVAKLAFDAIGAKRAFVCTDTREHRGWRQVNVAVLAIGPQFESHSGPSFSWTSYGRPK
jgi:hypothetical protein